MKLSSVAGRDWNAKVQSQVIPGATDKFGLGVQNEAGQKLTEFCQENTLVIANRSSNNTRDDSTHSEKVKVAQSCPTLCNPMDYEVHGVLQGRILEWVVFPFFRGSSQHKDQTQVSCTVGGFFTS